MARTKAWFQNTAGTKPRTPNGISGNNSGMSSNQQKRVRAFIITCRGDPRHSQSSLEGYLQLLVRRIPAYHQFVSVLKVRLYETTPY